MKEKDFQDCRFQGEFRASNVENGGIHTGFADYRSRGLTKGWAFFPCFRMLAMKTYHSMTLF